MHTPAQLRTWGTIHTLTLTRTRKCKPPASSCKFMVARSILIIFCIYPLPTRMKWRRLRNVLFLLRVSSQNSIQSATKIEISVNFCQLDDRSPSNANSRTVFPALFRFCQENAFGRDRNRNKRRQTLSFGEKHSRVDCFSVEYCLRGSRRICQSLPFRWNTFQFMICGYISRH